jgi:hypothetical protein
MSAKHVSKKGVTWQRAQKTHNGRTVSWWEPVDWPEKRKKAKAKTRPKAKSNGKAKGKAGAKSGGESKRSTSQAQQQSLF